MRRAFFIIGFALALCGAASAQAPKAAPTRLPPGWTAAATPAPAPTTRVPFGCDARAPDVVCYFRIFYGRGDRVILLPAGMTEMKVPATIGGGYCMTLDKAPAYKCTRKVINGKYNS
jgi:hypothetical protein